MTAQDGSAAATRRAADDAATDTEQAAAVAQLVLRERQSRDRGWWDRWSDCFADDSVVDMSWFTGSGAEFVRQTRLRSTAGLWGRHRLSPPAVQVDGAAFATYRPSYRCLAWYLSRTGPDLPPDLPPDLLGDDQPDAVARQYQAEHAWLHHRPTDPAEPSPTKEQ